MKPARVATAFYLVIAFAAGQAMSADLTDADRSKLKTNNTEIQTLVHASKEAFGLSVFTPGTAAATISSYSPLAKKLGTTWMKELQIENPVDDVRKMMAAQISRESGISNFRHLDIVANSSDNAIKKLKAQGGEMLLDYTADIRLMHYEGNVSDYYSQYSIRSRMIRLSDGKTLWNGYCNIKIEDNQPRSTDMLRANNGAILKTWLKRGSNDCAGKLADQFLGKSS